MPLANFGLNIIKQTFQVVRQVPNPPSKSLTFSEELHKNSGTHAMQDFFYSRDFI